MTRSIESNHQKPLYFAYGSNLNEGDLDRWCRDHGHSVGVMTADRPGYLLDHALDFSHFSRRRGGGALNVRGRKGAVVPGVLFQVHGNAGWQALDAKEGRGTRYHAVDGFACDLQGRLIPVVTYQVPVDGEVHHPTTPEYAQVVREGLVHHGLPTRWLDAAINHQTKEHWLDVLFIYGTLMQGQCRQHYLNQDHVRQRMRAELHGQLFDTGEGYPALQYGATPELSEDSIVQGEVLHCQEIESVLDVLDQVEGFDGNFGSTSSLYHRRLVTVATDHETHLAWTYTYAQSTQSMAVIPSGCWRTHCDWLA